MKPFIFCPSCATRLPEPTDENFGRRCPSCGRSWYANPAPTTGVALVRGDEVLVTVRARDPHKGKVDVPGGFLETGEDPAEGLRREVNEELGIDIEASLGDCVQAIPHIYGPDGEWLLSMGFIVRIEGEVELRPDDDVAEARWITGDELLGLDFAWEHDRQLVRKALRHG